MRFKGGFDGNFGQQNRMNGGSGPGPVRPTQNRQMGRINGVPYPNNAGGLCFWRSFSHF